MAPPQRAALMPLGLPETLVRPGFYTDLIVAPQASNFRLTRILLFQRNPATPEQLEAAIIAVDVKIEIDLLVADLGAGSVRAGARKRLEGMRFRYEELCTAMARPMTPPVAFVIESLTVDRYVDTNPAVRVTEINSPMPAEVFSFRPGPMSLDNSLAIQTVQLGMQIRLTVRNTDDVDHEIGGCLFGEVMP
jgi:hypothetical protein